MVAVSISPGIDWPAWVQAVGSVIAIGVAIAIPAYMRRQENVEKHSDRKLRARSLAMAFGPHLQATKLKLSAFCAKLDGDPAELAAYLQTTPVFVPHPEALTSRIEHLHLLGTPLCEAIITALEGLEILEGQRWLFQEAAGDGPKQLQLAEMIVGYAPSVRERFDMAIEMLGEFDTYWE